MNLCLGGQRGKFTFIKVLGTINSDSKLKIDFSYDVVIVIGSIRNRRLLAKLLIYSICKPFNQLQSSIFVIFFGAFLSQMDYSEGKNNSSLEICNLVRGWIPLLYS